MSDHIDFTVHSTWSGTGRSGNGTIISGNQSIAYSAPAAMGGQGAGTSPEELLMAAVTACYSGTLARVLQQRELTATRVDIRAEGLVSGYPSETRFARIVVHPTIAGGDAARLEEYAAAAEAARRRCFIGATLAGSVEYAVGEVQVG